MGFIKHVGRHGDRKVAIMYRKVPGEEHMALVIYPDTLPAIWHDAVMKLIESTKGQEAEQLSDAMDRTLLPDGRQMLQTLHQEGKIKKVRTNQIIVTPNATSHVHLDELNKIFDGIEDGGDAAKKMADLDNNLGMSGKGDAHLEIDETADMAPMDSALANSALDDVSLGTDLLNQSKQMAAEGAALVTESKRLAKEALKLNPALKPKRTVKKKTAKKKGVAK